MRYLLLLVSCLLLAAPALAEPDEGAPGSDEALTEPDAPSPAESAQDPTGPAERLGGLDGGLIAPEERLLCRELEELAFHEELSPGYTDPEDYGSALLSNWLGVPYAVGPPLRISGHGVSAIQVVPIKTWRPERLRIVLPVEEHSFPAQTELDSGVMVTFHFTPLEEEEVKTSLEDLMERDLQPKVGPDFVVMVDGIPLAGSSLSPMLPLDRISVPILDRTAWEVATYLSIVLDCEREPS